MVLREIELRSFQARLTLFLYHFPSLITPLLIFLVSSFLVLFVVLHPFTAPPFFLSVFSLSPHSFTSLLWPFLRHPLPTFTALPFPSPSSSPSLLINSSLDSLPWPLLRLPFLSLSYLPFPSSSSPFPLIFSLLTWPLLRLPFLSFTSLPFPFSSSSLTVLIPSLP